MNSAIVANINGGVSNQQVANGSHSSLLLSSIEFSLTEVKTNFSATCYQGKYLTKLTGKDEIFNGQNKVKNCDQNKNSIENAYLSINGNNEKSAEDSIPIPKIQLYTGKIHVEWNHVYKIGAGLNNLGNTCFMNTVIQCLTYCPPLANYLLHDNDHSSKCTVVGFCMMCLLQKHMKRTIGKTGEVIKPLDVYQRLKLIAKHFQFGRQEDAHEFLRYVIDHLWKACLPQTNGVTKLDSASKETTVINKIFGGYHRSQVICLRCKKESNTFDHFMDFILDIKQNVMSLEKALDKFTQPELLQQENCYKCPKCKMKVEAQKRFSVYRAPTVATFQLKRFDYNRSFGGKITKQITYPEKLNLRPYMSDVKGDPVWYRLNAVLVHAGPSCNSGHYYCYVKNSNGLWYIMDDQRVHQVSLNQVLNQSAYVLFYIKSDSSERTTMKKCLNNKSTIMKGALSNTHFSKVSEMGNLKPMPLSEKISPFSNSKSYGSPNSIKKFNSISNENREKISFGLRTNSSSVSLTSPKNRLVSSESVSAMHGGLVPYVEDSSDSSDASESNLSRNVHNSLSNMDANSVKLHTNNGSLDSYWSSPHLEIKTKLSKSVFSTPSHSSPSPKVSATGSWIVTDAPPVLSDSSSSTGVNSTTDWQVIEASDLRLNDSLKPDDAGITEFPDSPEVSTAETLSAKHLAGGSSSQSDPSGSAKKSAGYDGSPKCNFRNQIHKTKTHSPEDEETVGFKRKCGDSYSKVSRDSPYSQHSESGHSPVPKKAKYAENLPFLNQESGGGRNSSFHVDNNSSDSSLVQRQYSVPHCDNNSRTCVVNGLSSPGDSSRGSLGKNSNTFNGSPEKDKKSTLFSKGRLDNSFSDSKPAQFEKEKLPISNQGKNSSLYGTEVPTWREENHCRPSVVSTHENRRSFDDYDQEFDRGKVRKYKLKDRYQYFHQKNPFQKHADRYNGKYSGKFYNNHHNHRRYDSRHHWKPNHSSNYQRYRNHHRYY